ncbi:MAG: TolC family protein [Chitinophagales bacterium]|nr:TolC family protein [Chitinophagales bacterium]
MRKLSYIRTVSAVTFFLFTVWSVRAQEVWDWQKCIQYTFENNLDIQLSEIQTELAVLQLQQDKLNFTPMSQITGSYNYAVGRTVDMSTYQYVTQPIHTGNLQTSLSQPIFEGLKNINTLKKSKLDLQALRLDHEDLKQNIVLQLMNAYLNVLNADEQLQQSKELLEISHQQFENSKNLVDAGALAESALADNEAQIANDELNVLQLQQQLKLAYTALKTVMRLDQSEEIQILEPEVADHFETHPISSIDEIYQCALTHRVDVKSAEIKTESAEMDKKIARSLYMPSLSFFTGAATNFSDKIFETTSIEQVETPIGYLKTNGEMVYSLLPNPHTAIMSFGKQFSNNLSYAVGVNLTIPIYNRRAGYFGMKRAQLALLQNKINRDKTTLDLYDNIKEAHVRANSSIHNYEAAVKNLNAAQKSFDYAKNRLENGAISQLEFNLAQNNLLIAKSKLVQMKYDYIFNIKILDFYSGTNIEFE